MSTKDKDIVLNIKTTQLIQGEEPLVLDFVTEGKLFHKEGKTYLSYEESDVMGIKGQKSILIIEQDKVTMRKIGKSHEHDMNFIKGKKNYGVYSTQYGDFQIEFFTKNLDNQIGDDSGKVKIEYDLAIKNLSESENKIEIEYRR